MCHIILIYFIHNCGRCLFLSFLFFFFLVVNGPPYFRSDHLTVVIYFFGFNVCSFVEKCSILFAWEWLFCTCVFATVSSSKKIWNSRSMHSSDTAQHIIGVLVFTPRTNKNISLCFNKPNCKENLDSSNIHYSNWVEKHRNSLSSVHLFQ